NLCRLRKAGCCPAFRRNQIVRLTTASGRFCSSASVGGPASIDFLERGVEVSRTAHVVRDTLPECASANGGGHLVGAREEGNGKTGGDIRSLLLECIMEPLWLDILHRGQGATIADPGLNRFATAEPVHHRANFWTVIEHGHNVASDQDGVAFLRID